MNKLPEMEVSGPDAEFEEYGVGCEVRGEAISGHKIQGGDCSFDVAGICMADEIVLESFKFGFCLAVMCWGEALVRRGGVQ